MLQVPEGWLILKCRGRTPANSTVKLEDKREELTREVLDKKMPPRLPKVFAELTKKPPPSTSSPPNAPAATRRKEIEQQIQYPLPKQ